MPSPRYDDDREREASAPRPTHDAAGSGAHADGSGPSRALRALQSSVGNRTTGDLLRSGAPLVQRWRDFGAARGTPTSDYKIVEGEAGGHRYHLKFHNHANLDVFDEIHVVFENMPGDPSHPHFYYTDAGVRIPHKSSHAMKAYPELEPLAQQLVDDQLKTSKPVATDVVEALLKQKADQAAKDQVVKDKNASEVAEKQAAAVAADAAVRAASVTAIDDVVHLRNLLRDEGHGEGEVGAVLAYLRGDGEPRHYWKEAVDWYREMDRNGWKVVMDKEKVGRKKPDPMTAEQFRQLRKLPKDVDVQVKDSKAGGIYYRQATLSCRSYTGYVLAGFKRPK